MVGIHYYFDKSFVWKPENMSCLDLHLHLKRTEVRTKSYVRRMTFYCYGFRPTFAHSMIAASCVETMREKAYIRGILENVKRKLQS